MINACGGKWGDVKTPGIKEKDCENEPEYKAPQKMGKDCLSPVQMREWRIGRLRSTSTHYLRMGF